MVQSAGQKMYLYAMISDFAHAVAFTGHRTYDGAAAVANSFAAQVVAGGATADPAGRVFCACTPLTADAVLHWAVEELCAAGARTFLCGMAVGFDLAAAEAVLACREAFSGVELVCVVPFVGQEQRFCAADRDRYRRVLAAADRIVTLSPVYHAGCYAVRNNYLVDHASTLVAWYDGSPGGTHYTVRRAQRRGLVVRNLAPGLKMPISGTLF